MFGSVKLDRHDARRNRTVTVSTPDTRMVETTTDTYCSLSSQLGDLEVAVRLRTQHIGPQAVSSGRGFALCSTLARPGPCPLRRACDVLQTSRPPARLPWCMQCSRGFCRPPQCHRAGGRPRPRACAPSCSNFDSEELRARKTAPHLFASQLLSFRNQSVRKRLR